MKKLDITITVIKTRSGCHMLRFDKNRWYELKIIARFTSTTKYPVGEEDDTAYFPIYDRERIHVLEKLFHSGAL